MAVSKSEKASGVRVVCNECGQGGSGESPPYNCHRCGGAGTMEPEPNKVTLQGKSHAATKTVVLWSVTSDDRDAVWLKLEDIEWVRATPETDEVVVLDRDLAVRKGLLDGA